MVKDGAGPYAGGIIKFSIRVALANYPRLRPRVFFDNSVKLFHPLVHTMTNELRLEKREWAEGTTWIIDILIFIKKAFHLKEMFDVEKG